MKKESFAKFFSIDGKSIQSLEKSRKDFLHNVISLLGMILLLGFGMVNIFNHNLQMAFVEFFILILFIIAFAARVKSIRTEIPTYCAIGLVTFFFSYLIYTGGIEGAEFVWPFIFPTIVMYLVGHRTGVFISTGFAAIIACIVYIPGISRYAYSPELKLRFFLSYFTVSLITYISEYSRQHVVTLMNENEEKYKNLVERATDGIVIIQNGVIKYSNPSLSKIIGYDSEYALNQHYFSFFHPEYVEDIMERYRKRMTGLPTETVFETALRHKNGHKIMVEMNGGLTDFEGEPADLVFIRDITDRKAVEQEKEKLHQERQYLQKMEALGQLAGGVAHDLNNVLAIIKGFAELIRNNWAHTDPKLEHHINTILRSVDTSSETIANLLAYARKGKYELTDFDLNTTIDESCSLLYHSLSKKIKIVKDLNASYSLINGDRAQMQNLLINIAMNARDAMPKGGNLKFETEDLLITDIDHHNLPPGNYIHIKISDTGIGIDDEAKKHIFEPFFTTKEPGKGVGLGLAGIYGTVINHAGNIWFESILGKGTCFHIALPAKKPDIFVPSSVPDNEKNDALKSILIIDDEDDVREMLIAMLSSYGHHLIEAESGQHACTVYAQNYHNISLVILDMIMPQMSGYECFCHLKKINPEIKIIILSGYSANDQVREMLDKGALGFIKKPFSMDSLISSVDSAIGK